MAQIDDVGTARLETFADSIYLITPGNISLRYGAWSVTVGQFGAWTPLGVEKVGAGYQVVWKNGTADEFKVWNVNSGGTYVSEGPVLSGASAELQALETTFQQNFNGDATIGPIAAAIDAVGSTVLMPVGNTYYLYASGSTRGPQLRMNDSAVVAGQFGAWKPIGAEQVGYSYYQVVWQNGTADQYLVWTVDYIFGKWLSQGPVISGSSYALQSLEATFGQDFNKDLTVGLATTTIEASSATTLSQVAGTYSLYATGTATGPQLKMSGAAVTVGQFGAWTALGAEHAGSGYQVVWKNGAADQYITWNVDGGGNWLSYGNVVSGSSAELQALEAAFQQDFNGSGGFTSPTVIENVGTAALDLMLGAYMVIPSGGTVGPVLKMSGSAVTPGQFGGWAPLGAEQFGSGYRVVWKNGAADQYIVWDVDSAGNFLKQGNVLAGASAEVQGLEVAFNQDFNGGGISSPTNIETDGATDLAAVGDTYMVIPEGSSAGSLLKYGGAPVTAGQFGGWTPIGAEQSGGGYAVVWQNGGADQYLTWYIDGSGNFLSQTPVVSGATWYVQSFELNLQQDLNHDTLVGPQTSPVESSGGASLSHVADTYFVNHGSGGPWIAYGGSYVTNGQFGGWTPIAAEQSMGGYEVAWKNGSADQYLVWHIDGGGNWTSQGGVVSANSGAFQAFEAVFHQDLNLDGSQPSPWPFESSGSTSLTQVGSYYLFDGPGAMSGPLLSYGGSYVTAGQFGGWRPIGAEWAGNGYQVAWKMDATDQYIVWSTDAAGNFTSMTSPMFGQSSALEAYEPGLQQDLNFDGVTGVPTPAFNIVLNYSGNVGNYASYLSQAEARWEQIIVGDLPDVSSPLYGLIDDLMIQISIVSLDGKGGTLAQGGPDATRFLGQPSHGTIQIDSADIDSMVSNGTLTAVLTHEIGHVLGLGTLWDSRGLTTGGGYNGAHGLFAYQLLSGNPSATVVPLETEGGSGTAGVHWAESIFGNELMTSIMSGVPAPLSILTVAALQDLGYQVNYSAADAYNMPGHVMAGVQANVTYAQAAGATLTTFSSGTLTLSGTNTFGGGTTITNGTLLPAGAAIQQDEHHDQGWMLS